MNLYQKVARQSLGFLSVILALVGGAAMLALVIFGNIAIDVNLTSWLLLLTIPAGLVILALWMALVNSFMEWAVDCADR